MMPEWTKVILDMVSQFTGGRGGIDHVIVNYGLAAIFYAALLVVARAKYKEQPQPRERLLVWGFSIGLARELFMIVMAMIQALGLVDPVTLHIVFPPLEHTLLGVAMVTIAAAYVRYLSDDVTLTHRYLGIAVTATLLSYAATFWWWAEYIQANPTSKFGQVWPDWLFHINASVWLIIPAVFLAVKTQGKVRNLVIPALSLFFLSEFLKIPDMALGEVYEHIFAPIARVFYLVAIAMLGYIYIYEQIADRQTYLHDLEGLVQKHTRELEIALKELSKKNEQLNDLSHTDALTGLKNRRFFDSTLSAEWTRAMREQKPLSLLIIDVDHFKKVNDTHGHVGGDELLRIIADILEKALHRATDFGIRYGGDEFAVILANTD